MQPAHVAHTANVVIDKHKAQSPGAVVHKDSSPNPRCTAHEAPAGAHRDLTRRSPCEPLPN